MSGVAAYAVPIPGQQAAETKALIVLLLGIIGIVGGLFMAVFGLVLGLAGLIIGTIARSQFRRGLNMAGLIVSSLAVLTGLGVWVYAIQHDPRFNPDSAPVSHAQSATPAVVSADLSTPCYATGFVNRLNVSNSPGSCDMSAFNGQTLGTSTNAYKVYADKTQVESVNSFLGLAKNALEKDVSSNLTGFTLDGERIATFAGSPAYVVNTSDKAHNITVVEAAVMHKVSAGYNVFILVHATSGHSTDLDVLETGWQWK